MIFGAYHLNPFSIVPLVVLGFYFGFLVHRSGSVFVAASAHFMNNFVACAAVYLHLGDDFMIIAPTGEISPSVQLMNFVVSAFAFSAATLLFVRSTGEKRP
jgi:membrane protease YdiL (CAAX protease family)